MTKAGKLLTWIGLAIAVVTVIAGVILAISGFSKLRDTTGAMTPIGQTGLDQPTAITAEAGEIVVLYLTGRGMVVQPNCQVVDGPAPAQPGPGQSVNTEITVNTMTYRPFTSFRFTQSGTYAITCDGPGVVAGAPLSISGLFSGAGGIMLAVFGGLGGGFLLVLGIILWIVGANRDKRPPVPAGPYPGAPSQPYPGQPQPGQPYPGQPSAHQPFPGQPQPGGPGTGPQSPDSPAAPPSSPTD